VKYQRTEAFVGDYRRLSDAEKAGFRDALKAFVIAAERVASEPGAAWPSSLRVKSVAGARGVWEMAWSFSGPDGRATFEWVRIDGEPAIRWRRVGGHEIFKTP
jgi:hypothetical protein